VKTRLGNLSSTTLFHLPIRLNSSSTAVGLRRSPHATSTVVRTQRFEAVPQGLHVGIFVALKLEAGRNNLSGPGDARGVVVGLEHEVEVAGVGRVDGEVVRAVPGVGLGVGGEPCLCEMIVSVCFIDTTVRFWGNLPSASLERFWYFSSPHISSTFFAMALTCKTINSSRSL